ncbi:MAG: glycoside hydrolase family 3 protein [Gammaproteobacteria bacterium]|nr:MAG: glycoside hydrolase family 3 protein [Gammaproteobacteria bacterium]
MNSASWLAGIALAAAGPAAVALAGQVEWPPANTEIAADPAIERRIDELLGQLSLERKIGQMVQAEIRNVSPADVRKFGLGSILNGGGSFPGGKRDATREDWLELADAFYAASMDTSGGRVPIPVIWGTDAVHGHNNVIGATLFPHNIALGAAHDPELVERIGRATAAEVAATGLDWIFAPTVAVARDLRWGRTYESYSEDPALVRRYARHMVWGLQGRPGADLFGPWHRIATAKHFIGDGATDGGVDQGNASISETELRDIHAQGYYGALPAGVQTVMASFNSWQGQKVHGNRYLLTEILKERMGFDGFVVSDWNAIGQVPGCSNQSCPQAINAGIDMIMAPENNWRGVIRNTLEQVRAGEIPQSRIDDAVRRILRVKLRAGLFEAGPPSAREAARAPGVLGSAEHRQLAAEAVRKSLVLLKNKGGLLPLDPGSRILVAGDGADNIGKQSGGWTISWQGSGNSNADFPGGSSILDGIRRKLSSGGGSLTVAPDGRSKEAVDAAIVVFGEDPYAEGQGDLESISYSARKPEDLALLRRLQASGIPVVAVFLTGRPLWVNPELNAADAFVVAWLPGSQGGAVADLLFRDADGGMRYDFSGRLSFSWPADPSQAAVNIGDEPYTPLFPVGYGLGLDDQDSLGDDLPETDTTAKKRDLAQGLAVFDARPLPPFKAFLGDSGGWQLPLGAGSVRSNAGALEVSPVDLEVQEDALRLHWTGKGDGQFYFQAPQPLDLRPLAKRDGALQFLLRVERPPAGKVTLRLDCGYPCASSADLSRLLKALPGNSWVRLSIALRCFARQGLKLEHVDTPFLLLSGSPLTLSVARIELLPDIGERATIPCR